MKLLPVNVNVIGKYSHALYYRKHDLVEQTWSMKVNKVQIPTSECNYSEELFFK